MYISSDHIIQWYDVILGNIPGVNDKWNRDKLIDEDQGSKVMQTEQSNDREETQAVVTRRMAREENKTRKPLAVIEGIDEVITRDGFIKLQTDDDQAQVEIVENGSCECISTAVIEPDERDEAELNLFERGQTESFRDVDVNPDFT